MFKKILICLLPGLLILNACKNNENTADSNKIEEVRLSDKYDNAEIIRNPISLNKPVDTINIPKILFEETSYNFGKAKEGTVVNKIFKYKNAGKAPLLISDVQSSCGCTASSYTKDPLAPGETGQISVRFDTKGKEKQQQKVITIYANTYPTQTRLALIGEVVK